MEITSTRMNTPVYCYKTPRCRGNTFFFRPARAILRGIDSPTYSTVESFLGYDPVRFQRNELIRTNDAIFFQHEGNVNCVGEAVTLKYVDVDG